jgi:hypothetical protein
MIHGFLSNYVTMARVFRRLNKYYSGAYRPKQQWVVIIEMSDYWRVKRDLELFLFRVYIIVIGLYENLYI